MQEENSRKEAYHRWRLETLDQPAPVYKPAYRPSFYSSSDSGPVSIWRVLLVLAIYALPFAIFAG